MLLPVDGFEWRDAGRMAVAAGDEKPRPLLLLPHAEPTEVTALVPDGPPRRFRWRGVTYEVAGAQGPERIASRMVASTPSAHSREAGTRMRDAR